MADRKFFHGVISLGSGAVFKLAVQLAVLPILARELGPSAYGLMAIALSFVLFAQMLSDAGMGAALAREQNPTPALEATIFWISMAIGLAICPILLLAAEPIARAFEEPALSPILMSMALLIVLISSLTVPNARLTRTRRFGAFAAGEVIGTTLGVAAALVMAVRGFGAWALVIQQLVYWGVKVVMLYWASRFRPRFAWDLAAARPHLRFGLNMVGANFSEFLNRNTPALVIGSALGAAPAGHYSLANQLARLPETVVAGALYLPLFSTVAKLQAEGVSVQPALRRTVKVMFLLLAPFFCGMALLADLFVPLLLGEKWVGTERALQMLSLGLFLVCLYSPMGATLQGIGRSDVQFRVLIASSALILLGALVGAQMGSAAAAAAGISLALVVTAGLFVRALAKHVGVQPGDFFADLWAPTAAVAVMAAAVLVLRAELAGEPAWAVLCTCVAVGGLVYLTGVVLLGGRRLLGDLAGLLPERLRVRLTG